MYADMHVQWETTALFVQSAEIHLILGHALAVWGAKPVRDS